MAFNSNQSGRFQVYVGSLDGVLPASDAAPALLRQGCPRRGCRGIVWRKDGRELFYLSQPPPQTVMAVDVASGPAFKAGTPRKLFQLETPVGAPAAQRGE